MGWGWKGVDRGGLRRDGNGGAHPPRLRISVPWAGFCSVPIIRLPKPRIAERPGRGRGGSASAAQRGGGTLRVMEGGFGDLILMCASLWLRRSSI